MIFHSDRGCQYTSQDYAALARDNGVILSVSRKGECWDNAVAESFFATIKREVTNDRAGRPGPGFSGPSSTTSRAGTTPAGCKLPRLPQPCRIRVNPPQRRPTGGMINSRNLSVKADQAQDVLAVRGGEPVQPADGDTQPERHVAQFR